MKNLGQYSLGDVIATRFPSNKVRSTIAFGTFLISICYMIPQLVAAGLLIRLLLGIDYSISVLVIGGLMTIYVVFGGMIATSWVQIVKTVLLMSGIFLVSLIVLARFDWQIVQLVEHVKQGTPLGLQFFMPGNLFDHFLEMFSLKLALILGTAGLPHILIRFFTVNNTLEVRRSVITATWIIGTFYVMTLVLGLGAVALVGYNKLHSVDTTGNLAAMLLAKELGGDFLLAFISALAFTTIVAVVTGLVISATISLSHDIYHHIIRKGQASEKEQLQVAKWTAVGIGFIATIFSLGLENINVTFLVSLTFVIAAASNLPIILFTLYWRRFNETGAIVGMYSGFFSSLILVVFGPHIMNINNGWIAMEPFFPLYNPGIIAIPIGFIGAIIGTILSSKKEDPSRFMRTFIKAQTGIDIRGRN